MKNKLKKKLQIILVILSIVLIALPIILIPLHVRSSQTSGIGTQKTILIFQETRVWSETDEQRDYLDVEMWRMVSSAKNFEIIIVYVGQDDFNPKKIIKHYSEISTEMYLVFNTHGSGALFTYFLKLDIWRTSSSIIRAIGDTKTCIVVASCYGKLFVTRTSSMFGENIECVTFTNETTQTFYQIHVFPGISVFTTIYGPPFIDLLRSHSAYEAYQVINKLENFTGAYWSFKTGLIN